MKNNVFINFSNHNSKDWSEEQCKAAFQYADRIIDIPFPSVDPEMDEDGVRKIGDEYLKRILEYPVAAVMCQGEFSLVYYVVSHLERKGVISLAACSRRNVRKKVLEDGRTVKESEFEFIRFRRYKGTDNKRLVFRKPEVSDEL